MADFTVPVGGTKVLKAVAFPDGSAFNGPLVWSASQPASASVIPGPGADEATVTGLAVISGASFVVSDGVVQSPPVIADVVPASATAIHIVVE